MDSHDPNAHYEAALEMAANAREAYQVEPTASNFRVWRDASEIAIKWNRAVRLGDNEESADWDDQLAKMMKTKEG